MKLKKLTERLKSVMFYPEGADTEISALTKDSRTVCKGGLFFCLHGRRCDGSLFVREAISGGAVAIVTDKYIEDISAVQAVVPDVREAFSVISAAFYGNPQDKLKIIGVVGTNGKTSVAHILTDILNADGKRAAVIGTLGSAWSDKTEDTILTTPDPDDFFRLLKEMAGDGIKYVVTEFSAHAIYLKKLAAVNFDCLIFTNCTQDHLDYFRDFSVYCSVKKSAFTSFDSLVVVNADDSLGAEIASENKLNTITYGMAAGSSVRFYDLTESPDGLSFTLVIFGKKFKITSALCGNFNAYNISAAAAAATALGVLRAKIPTYVSKVKPVSGRMERVAVFHGASVFVDYAHTPDGIEKSLCFLKSITRGKVYIVFGAGGDRDKTKRPMMGEIAGNLSDFVVLTNDNPRFESPDVIIRDIEVGIKRTVVDYIIIEERYAAISYALSRLKKGDSLLIAGKGAEEYIESKGEKLPFSDKAALNAALNAAALKLIKESDCPKND